MNKKWIMYILFMGCYISSFSQSLLTEQIVAEQLIRMPVNDAKMSKEYEGTPFLYDTFTTATVYMKNNTKFRLPMRYNIYQDIIEVKYEARDMQILPNDLIMRIELNNHNIVAGDYVLDNKKVSGFLFLLDSGEVSLLKKRNISFTEWRPAKAQESGPKPASFKPGLDKFFIQSRKNLIIPINSIKDLSNLFPHHQTQVSNYIKKNKIKLKEDKLIELFQYYNKLSNKTGSIPKS